MRGIILNTFTAFTTKERGIITKRFCRFEFIHTLCSIGFFGTNKFERAYHSVNAYYQSISLILRKSNQLKIKPASAYRTLKNTK